MPGLNVRSFFWQWQAVYAASNPGRDKERWEVDGVTWIRERHTYWGGVYSLQLEIHRLEHRRVGKHDWQILVVIERWWGADRSRSLRDHSWAKLIAGRSGDVLAWLRRQSAGSAASGLSGASGRP